MQPQALPSGVPFARLSCVRSGEGAAAGKLEDNCRVHEERIVDSSSQSMRRADKGAFERSITPRQGDRKTQANGAIRAAESNWLATQIDVCPLVNLFVLD